jgi:hypothetical protein
MVFEGLLGLGAGTISFVWPGITAMALVYLIAAWAFVTGILEIVAAIRLRKEIEGEWLLALTGVLSLVLAVLFAMAPDAGAVALIWLWGAYAAAFGVLLVWLGFRLRGRQEARKTTARSPGGQENENCAGCSLSECIVACLNDQDSVQALAGSRPMKWYSAKTRPPVERVCISGTGSCPMPKRPPFGVHLVGR